VYLNVTLDSLYIREATLQEAQAFWAAKKSHKHPMYLNWIQVTTGLGRLDRSGSEFRIAYRREAANFGKLTKGECYRLMVPCPSRRLFAIPFYYYHQHIRKYGLDLFINSMQTTCCFQTKCSMGQKQLEHNQDSIKTVPYDTSLLRLVKDRALLR